MSDWNLQHEIIKAVLSTISAAVLLGLSWLIGQKLTYQWNLRQKRRELQLSALQQFYVAYGEFFAVWKLWNRTQATDHSYEDRVWELHKRAAAAEAIVEGTLVKLCSELKLEPDQIEMLAAFRQSFQQLRQSIRNRTVLPWFTSETPAYREFKKSAVYVACLLNSGWPRESNSTELSAEHLLEVTANKWQVAYKQRHPDGEAVAPTRN